MTSLVLFALLAICYKSIHAVDLSHLGLESDAKSDLDLMDFQRALAAEKSAREIEEKRELVDKALATLFDESAENEKREAKDFTCDGERKRQPKLCNKYIKYCKIMPQLKKLCPVECEVDCPAPAPPACSFTTYGCCWNDNPAKGPDGFGCPPCVNTGRGNVCLMFSSMCKAKSARKYMKLSCPQTCGHCGVKTKK